MNCPRRIIAMIVLATVGHPRPTYAAVMSAGSMEITRLVQDGGGGPGLMNGEMSMDISFGQPAWGAPISSGTYVLAMGYYASAGAGGPPGAGFALPEDSNCPPTALRNAGNVYYGMSPAERPCISFNKIMLDTRLPDAVRVVRERDQYGTSLNALIQSTVAYDANRGNLRIGGLAGGPWTANSFYRVELSTWARDMDGFPLAAPVTFYFQVLADPATSNVFVPLGDPGTRLTLSPNAMPATGYILINTDPVNHPVAVSPTVVQSATAKLHATHGPYTQVQALRELHFFNAQGQGSSLSFADGAARLSISYQDADGDGIIDGTNPPARAKAARIYSLDETNGLWVRLPGSAVETGAVSVTPPHLSVFALITTADVSVNDVYAFPVPFRPHGPDAGTGPGQTGTDSAGITFVNLPAPAEIDVYNILGEKVWHGEERAGLGQLVWDTRNSSGHATASGVYFYVIRNSSDDTKTGKLAIIR